MGYLGREIMRKKDYWIFVAIVFGLIITGGIPRLLIALGFASDHLRTYTADENGILYLAANRQVRIIDREGHETRFIAPFAATSIRKLNENTLLLIKDNRSVQIRKDGTILSTETEEGGISDTDNIARPLNLIIQEATKATIHWGNNRIGKGSSRGLLKVKTGKNHVCKGSVSRMNTSAAIYRKVYSDPVVSKVWTPAINTKTAFVDEWCHPYGIGNNMYYYIEMLQTIHAGSFKELHWFLYTK